MAVDETALDLVSSLPSSYASMSHYEFFAELYALYFDTDNPLRANIPADTVTWFQENIENYQPSPFFPMEERKKELYEEIIRPENN